MNKLTKKTQLAKKRYKKPTVIKSFSEKELGPWIKRPGNMWGDGTPAAVI